MSIEAQVPEIPTAPAETEAPTEALPEEQQPEGEATEETTEGEEGEEPEAPEPTVWNPDEALKDPAIQEWHEGERSAAFRDGHITGQKREAGQRKEVLSAAREVATALTGVNQALKVIGDNGLNALDKQTFEAILEDYPVLKEAGKLGAVDEPKLMARAAIGTASTMALIATEFDDPQLHKFWGRLVQPSGKRMPDGSTDFEPTSEFEYDNGGGAIKDFVKAVKKNVESKAEEKGYQRGLKEGKGITGEAGRVEARAGKGPASVKGSTGGGKTYSTMTYEERQALTPAERDRLAAQEG